MGFYIQDCETFFMLRASNTNITKLALSADREKIILIRGWH